jgi:hypothetical protein
MPETSSKRQILCFRAMTADRSDAEAINFVTPEIGTPRCRAANSHPYSP